MDGEGGEDSEEPSSYCPGPMSGPIHSETSKYVVDLNILWIGWVTGSLRRKTSEEWTPPVGLSQGEPAQLVVT